MADMGKGAKEKVAEVGKEATGKVVKVGKEATGKVVEVGKEATGKAIGVGKEVSATIKEVQEKEWAEPTACALKATGAIINGLAFIPGASVLAGAFSMGASVLNPDPSLADLRRAKNEIKEDVREAFRAVAETMEQLQPELEGLRDDISEAVSIICDSQFHAGIEDVDAAHKLFMDGEGEMEKTNKRFFSKSADFEMNFNKNFKPQKVFKFMKIVLAKEGQDACTAFYNDLIVSTGLFLQVMVIHLTYSDEVKRLAKLFSSANGNIERLTKLYEGLLNVPEEKSIELRRRKSVTAVRRVEVEEVGEEEARRMEEQGNAMEAKIGQGLVQEADKLYQDLFNNLKNKCFKPEQRILHVNLLSDIVFYNTVKHQYDEAFAWSVKVLELLDQADPAELQCEVLARVAVAFANKNEFKKAKMMIDRAAFIARGVFGEHSKQFGGTMKAYAKILTKTDKREKSNKVLEEVLKIESREAGGRRGLDVAKTLGLMAWNEYFIQDEQYGEAIKQAEEAMKIIQDTLGKKSFLLVAPKNTLAGITQFKAGQSSGKEKEQLLKQAEKMRLSCMEISVAHLGEYNPWTAGLMGNLAKTYRAMNRSAEAEKLQLKTLHVKTSILGPDDAGVAATNAALGVLYLTMGEMDKAEGFYLEDIRITETLFGLSYSQLKTDYGNIRIMYQATGDKEKEELYEAKIAKWEEAQEKKEDLKIEGEKQGTEVFWWTLEKMVKYVSE